MGLTLLYLTLFIAKRRLFHQFYNTHNTPKRHGERVTNEQVKEKKTGLGVRV